LDQAGAARGSPPSSLRPRFHPASPCNVSERSFPARLLCCPFTIRIARACCAQLWGGGAGTQLLTPFRTVHLHTHIREHTACPVYVLILCVHGNSQYALLEHVVHSSGVVVQAHNCWHPSGLCTYAHVHDYTACPVYVCILCVHGNFSRCTGVVCIIGLLGRTHSLPIYVLIRSDLLCRGAAHLHHHSLFVMLCTNNCHVCWKLKHNSLLPISLCAW
jgi:hypothetical protein